MSKRVREPSIYFPALIRSRNDRLEKTCLAGSPHLNILTVILQIFSTPTTKILQIRALFTRVKTFNDMKKKITHGGDPQNP